MLSGKQKAAIFLKLLGSQYSGRVLDHLPKDVSDEIARILAGSKKKPTSAEVSEVLTEFDGYMSSAKEQEVGGKDRPAGSPISMITSATPSRLAKALKGERPEFIAFVLSHLPVERIYDVLSLLGDARKEIEEKLLHMKDVPMTDVFQNQVLDIVARRLGAV